MVQGTVYEAFRRSAALYPDHPFLCVLPETARQYGTQPHTFSYRESEDEIDALKQRYAAAGLGPGHRAGLLLENRPAVFFHWLALNALGVSVVPINPEWRRAELAYLIAHSEICLAVAPVSRASELARAADEAQCRLILLSSDLDGLQHVPEPAIRTDAIPGEQNECALLYTSGTTGRPKGCVLTNEYYLWAGSWYAQCGDLCALALGSERLLTPLPMSHMNAMACSTMVMLLTGGCVVPLDRFHPATWWDSVRQSGATIVHYLGVMPAMLLGAAPTDLDREHRVRFGFGAGVSPRLHAAFESRFGFPLLEAWAMTETGAGAAIIANREPRKVGSACFGRAAARIDYRVVDDAGRDTARGEPGELLVRSGGSEPGFGFFREYLKDPAATSQAWEGGYFHTGDIVYIDPDGDFHFVDRRRNVIRRSGENISAVEVEGVLLQHPAVAAVGVTAVPDAVRGDEVMACVVLRGDVVEEDPATLARDIAAYCLERISYFKVPGYIAFCSSLPLTPTEKIQRAQLKEQGNSLLGTLGCIDLRALKKRGVPA